MTKAGLPTPNPQPIRISKDGQTRRIPKAEYEALTKQQKEDRAREQARLRQRARRTRKQRVDALLHPDKYTRKTKKQRKGKPGRPRTVIKLKKKEKLKPGAEAARLAFTPKRGGSPRPQSEDGKHLHMTTQLRWILMQPDPDEPAVTIGRQILQVAANAAKAGHFAFFKEIIDRIDGKVPEKLMIDMTERLVKDQAAGLCHTLLNAVEDVAREYLPEEKAGEFTFKIGERVYKSLRNGHGKPALTLTHGGLEVLTVDAAPAQESPDASAHAEGANHGNGTEATTNVPGGVLS